MKPTPPLAEFRAAYTEDDNLWWGMGSGHHQNLFDAACEQLDKVKEELQEQRTTWVDAFAHFCCDEHAETHVGEFAACPYCVADRLREELAQAKACNAAGIANTQQLLSVAFDERSKLCAVVELLIPAKHRYEKMLRETTMTREESWEMDPRSVFAAINALEVE